MYSIHTTAVFDTWFAGLKDRQAARRIQARIDRVEDVLKEGEVIEFQVVGKDPRTGKLKLSRRVLLPKPEGYVEREPAMEGGDGRERRDDRPRREFRDRGPRRD